MRCVFLGCKTDAIYLYNGYSFCIDHANPISYMETHMTLLDCPIDGTSKSIGYLLTKIGFDAAVEIQMSLLEEAGVSEDKMKKIREGAGR